MRLTFSVRLIEVNVSTGRTQTQWIQRTQPPLTVADDLAIDALQHAGLHGGELRDGEVARGALAADGLLHGGPAPCLGGHSLDRSQGCGQPKARLALGGRGPAGGLLGDGIRRAHAGGVEEREGEIMLCLCG